jgi:hypothetical protein
MRASVALAILTSVSAQQRLRAVVEIERDERTISGHVAINDAEPTGFFGWLELIDTLERAADKAAVERRPDDSEPRQ